MSALDEAVQRSEAEANAAEHRAFLMRLHAERTAEEQRSGRYLAGPEFWLAEVRRRYPDFEPERT